MTKQTRFKVSVVDYFADGKPQTLKTFDTLSQAQEYVRRDMDGRIEEFRTKGYDENILDYDYDAMTFSIAGSDGYDWLIEEIEIPA